MLTVTSCFHLCMSWSSSAILPKLTPAYKHSFSGNRGWAECFPGNSSLTSGQHSGRVSDDATNVRFGSESTRTPCLAHGCQCYVAPSKGGEFGGERTHACVWLNCSPWCHLRLSQHCLVTGYTPNTKKKVKKTTTCDRTQKEDTG